MLIKNGNRYDDDSDGSPCGVPRLAFFQALGREHSAVVGSTSQALGRHASRHWDNCRLAADHLALPTQTPYRHTHTQTHKW